MADANGKENIQTKIQGELKQTEVKTEADKIPLISLAGKEIPVDVLKEISEEAAAFYKIVPIAKSEDALEAGMVNPDDLKAREALRFIAQRSGAELKIYAISQVDFDGVLAQYRSLRGEVKKALRELEEELEVEKERPAASEAEEIFRRVVVETPVTKIVAVILRHAVEGDASDIHIEGTEKQIKVRFRVDGILYASIFLPKDIQQAVITRIKILSNLKIDETRVPQDGRFQATVSGRKIDFRVSTLPTANGEKAVLRVLDPKTSLKTFADLGLQGHNIEMLEEAIEKPFGMILITGPTGSGKTTTLYAILSKLNQEAVNIISLEDPVEYVVEGVNQSQIKPEIGYTFASGLRSILRQDPDIIMAGEIRDEETADLAIHAALTGHIVLSTLHTNNAIGVIPRLIDMGVDTFLLPSSLNLSIAQRLIRRLCPHCKKEVEPSPQVSKIIESELAGIDLEPYGKEINFKKPYKVFRAQGCKLCNGKGTKGRVAIYEMMSMTPEVEQIINQGVNETKLKAEAKRQGMVTMRQDGIIKVLQGVVSAEEVLEAVEVEDNF